MSSAGRALDSELRDSDHTRAAWGSHDVAALSWGVHILEQAFPAIYSACWYALLVVNVEMITSGAHTSMHKPRSPTLLRRRFCCSPKTVLLNCFRTTTDETRSVWLNIVDFRDYRDWSRRLWSSLWIRLLQHRR